MWTPPAARILMLDPLISMQASPAVFRICAAPPEYPLTTWG